MLPLKDNSQTLRRNGKCFLPGKAQPGEMAYLSKPFKWTRTRTRLSKLQELQENFKKKFQVLKVIVQWLRF